jgi:hypothetical protein
LSIVKDESTDTHAANAPRWLISKGRKEDAIRTLEKVRPKEDVGAYSIPPNESIQSKLMDDIAAGVCKDEADAIEEALNNNVDKGPWIDLFVSFSLNRIEILHTLRY